MKNLLHINDKPVTDHNKCSKIPPPISMHFATHTKTARCSSDLIFTFLYAGGSIENMSDQIVSRIHLSFVNFALQTTPQTKI